MCEVRQWCCVFFVDKMSFKRFLPYLQQVARVFLHGDVERACWAAPHPSHGNGAHCCASWLESACPSKRFWGWFSSFSVVLFFFFPEYPIEKKIKPCDSNRDAKAVFVVCGSVCQEADKPCHER